MLYFFKGAVAHVGGQRVQGPVAIELRADMAVELANGPDDTAEFLVLQGRPIAEPVVQYGPFVMNTQQEIKQAMHDFQNGKLG
jgi:redox-sensitive bicupin YhaK (pirin superfamily)